MAKFEAEIAYEGQFKGLLETYADSMGWSVEPVGHPEHPAFVMFRGEGTHEEDLLRDMEGHIRFFMSEDEAAGGPAPPLSYRIVRVIFDSVSGYDEITDDSSDEAV